jgi:hypothetical protein
MSTKATKVTKVTASSRNSAQRRRQFDIEKADRFLSSLADHNIYVAYSINRDLTPTLTNHPYRIQMTTALSPEDFQNLDHRTRSVVAAIYETQWFYKDQKHSMDHDSPFWNGDDPTEAFESRVLELARQAMRVTLVQYGPVKSELPPRSTRGSSAGQRAVGDDELEDLVDSWTRQHEKDISN